MHGELLRRHGRLIWLFLRVSVQDDAAYRADFVGHVVMAFVQLGGELVGLWTIFSNTPSLAGWSPLQIIVLLGVFRIMTGTIGMFIAPNMRKLMEDVREGTLDFVLMTPVNSQFHVSVRRMVVWRITDVLLGLCLAGYAAVRLSGAPSIGQVLLFGTMLASGVVIIYSLWLVLASSSFWFTRISNIEMVFWNIFEAGRYPVGIYRPWVRWVLTYLIPLAFLTTVPASALVGKVDYTLALWSLFLAGLTFTGASWFWRFGVRRYSGASA